MSNKDLSIINKTKSILILLIIKCTLNLGIIIIKNILRVNVLCTTEYYNTVPVYINLELDY
jgi:hypothetical protein